MSRKPRKTKAELQLEAQQDEAYEGLSVERQEKLDEQIMKAKQEYEEALEFAVSEAVSNAVDDQNFNLALTMRNIRKEFGDAAVGGALRACDSVLETNLWQDDELPASITQVEEAVVFDPVVSAYFDEEMGGGVTPLPQTA